MSLVLAITTLLTAVSVDRANAVSDDVLIMQLQTAGPVSGTASQEFVLLYNASDADVDVTGWCIEYSSAANGLTFIKLGCVEPLDRQTELWLSTDGYLAFASEEFIEANDEFTADFPISAGIAASGGHLRIVTASSVEVDRVGWGGATIPEGIAADAHDGGMVLGRDFLAENLDSDMNMTDFTSQAIISLFVSGMYEQTVIIDLCANIDGVQQLFPEGFLADENGDCFADFCSNLEDLQITAPVGYEKISGSDECTPIPLGDAVLFITELLPNAPGVDTGQEFVELYNPNTETVDISGYRLQVGPGFSKEFIFPATTIGPGVYAVFSDSITGITLPNTNGVELRLLAPVGTTVSQTTIYSSASDDVSWSLVEDQWIYTNQITPGSANKPFLIAAVDEINGVTSVLAPCPVGKFRNPLTNRCKTNETAISQLVPCESNEFRNPETNRCNKISSTTAGLSPCPEGQKRNPETNRCRNEAILGTSDGELPTITDIAVQNTEGQINWLVISVTVLGTLGYMIYEWRFELKRQLASFKRGRFKYLKAR